MRIFVTGATGFIGRHLCQTLSERGHQVIALVRSPEKARTLPEAVETVEGDLSRFRDPLWQLPVHDVFIHLAGVVTARSDEEYRRVNFGAVCDIRRCLEAQSTRPRRILFASSLAAVGPSDGEIHDEKSPMRPIDAYGAAKCEAERELASSSIDVTSFRPAMVLGPGDPAFLTLFRMAKRGLGFQLAGQNQGLSVICVKDLVEAIVKMALDEREGHRCYFVADKEPISIRGLWKCIGSALGKKVRIVPIPKAALWTTMKVGTGLSKYLGVHNQLDSKQYEQIVAKAWVCSSALLQKDLDWQPQVSVADGAQETARGYQELGWL